MALSWLSAVLLLAAGLPAAGAELSPDTASAFNRYIRLREARLDQELGSTGGFLWGNTGERRKQLQKGLIAVEKRTSLRELRVPDGLVHDWIGAVFIPGVTLAQTLAFVQNYDHHKEVYRPEVIDSRLLSRDGNDFRVRLRMLKKKVLTVVLNTEHEVHYQQVTRQCWRSRSTSLRITEVADPGSAAERELPEGTGRGFLWRLNSYWTFQELDGGTYVECEAVSLSRDVPKAMAWLIDPIVRQLPRESLTNTLRATRDGLAPPDKAP